MARGAQAKLEVTKILQSAFGENYLGEYDKKIYVQALEDGQMVQIAISLTCPKNPVTVSTGPIVHGDRMDFENSGIIAAHTTDINTEITEEERKTIAELMKRCGL